MGALSLRLSDELETQLAREADVEGRPKSEVARRALAEWLTAREKKRFMDAMVRAAKLLYSDPAVIAESREIQADFDAIDTTLGHIEAEERATALHPDDPAGT